MYYSSCLLLLSSLLQTNWLALTHSSESSSFCIYWLNFSPLHDESAVVCHILSPSFFPHFLPPQKVLFFSKENFFWLLFYIYFLPLWKQQLAGKITDGLCIYSWSMLKLLTCVVRKITKRWRCYDAEQCNHLILWSQKFWSKHYRISCVINTLTTVLTAILNHCILGKVLNINIT